MFNATSSTRPRVFINAPSANESFQFMPVNRAVTIDKARRLGVTPTPLEAAMSATVEQMRAGRRA